MDVERLIDQYLQRSRSVVVGLTDSVDEVYYNREVPGEITTARVIYPNAEFGWISPVGEWHKNQDGDRVHADVNHRLGVTYTQALDKGYVRYVKTSGGLSLDFKGHPVGYQTARKALENHHGKVNLDIQEPTNDDNIVIHSKVHHNVRHALRALDNMEFGHTAPSLTRDYRESVDVAGFLDTLKCHSPNRFFSKMEMANILLAFWNQILCVPPCRK